MHNSIAASIRNIATAVLVIGFIVAILSFLLLIKPLGFLLALITGALMVGFTWIASTLVDGFAELIELSQIIAHNTSAQNNPAQPANTPAPKNNQPQPASAPQQKVEPQIFADGSWRCFCGRTNPSYLYTCSCHTNKSEALKHCQNK